MTHQTEDISINTISDYSSRSNDTYEKSFIDSDSSYQISNDQSTTENNSEYSSNELISSFHKLLKQKLNKLKTEIINDITTEMKQIIIKELSNEFEHLIQKIFQEIELIKNQLKSNIS